MGGRTLNGTDKLRIHLMLLAALAFSVAGLGGTLVAAALEAPVDFPPLHTMQ